MSKVKTENVVYKLSLFLDSLCWNYLSLDNMFYMDLFIQIRIVYMIAFES